MTLHAGCLKEEYSYEATPVDSTTTQPIPVPLPDTTQTAPPLDTASLLETCPYCEYATSITLGQWQVFFDSTFLCGKNINASLNGDKTTFSLYGPSACVANAALIINADFSPVTFDSDRAGLTTTRVSCRYYDSRSPTDVFTTDATHHVTLTINQYQAQSGTAIGQFQGKVVTSTGKVVPVSTGMFKMQLQ